MKRLMVLFVLVIALVIQLSTFDSFRASGGLAAAQGKLPVVDGSVRDGLNDPKDGNPDKVIDGSIVQALDVPQFEDRGIIEFDVSDLPEPIQKVDLVLNVFASNGPFPFTVDVFTYTGDGLLSLNDFNAGSLFTSFEYSGEPTIVLDVTSFIKNVVASGENFAGFNFQFTVPSNIPLNGPFVAFNSLEVPPAASLESTSAIFVVPIDIKPGSDSNSINCKNEKGVIPVAILATDDFDATTVDHATVTFEGASETHVNKKSGEPKRHEEDVDGDGDTDLVFHFRLGETDLTCDSTEGTLTGETFAGVAIEGTDTIRMVN